MGKKWDHMDGTEGTGDYVVLCRTGRGKVGVRKLGESQFRVRVEPFGSRFVPAMAELMQYPDWKCPGDNGQNRFSAVVCNNRLREVVSTTLKAIGYPNLVHKTKTGDSVPEWAQGLLPE